MKPEHVRRAPAKAGINLGLIITPMLDMSFQILAFFIMTYNPSALEGHIPASFVPPSAPGPGNDLEIELLEEAALIPANVIQVKIKSTARGQEVGNRLEGYPSQIHIKQPADADHVLLTDVDASFDAALRKLETRLKVLFTQEAGAKTDLKIDADGELRQQYVMQVYDTCKKAGFDKVHLVAPILNAKLR